MNYSTIQIPKSQIFNHTKLQTNEISTIQI